MIDFIKHIIAKRKFNKKHYYLKKYEEWSKSEIKKGKLIKYPMNSKGKLFVMNMGTRTALMMDLLKELNPNITDDDVKLMQIADKEIELLTDKFNNINYES